MRNKIKVISGVLFLSIFIIPISCQKQNAEWKGTVEEENRVIVCMSSNDSDTRLSDDFASSYYF